jgi:hypothetical protein
MYSRELVAVLQVNVADRLRRWSVQNENHGTDLKRLCEDCGELPSAAKAALNFRELRHG